MNRCLDFLRLIFVSPELLFALVPFAIFAYEPAWADVLLKPMSEGRSLGAFRCRAFAWNASL